MKLSTKGKYGLMAIVDMAVQAQDEPMPLKVIAERNSISEGYLEQVFSTLKKAGLVLSVKGAQGGYSLAVPAEEMTVGMVLRVLEGDLSTAAKPSEGSAEASLLGKSIYYMVYEQIDNEVNKILDNTTIAQVAAHYAKSQHDAAWMFFI